MKSHCRKALSLLGSICLLGAELAPGVRAEHLVITPAPRTDVVRVPMRFEENRGQSDPRVRFVSRGANYSLFLTPEETVLVLRNAGGVRPASSAATLRMEFVGADKNVEVAGQERLTGSSNYFVGRDPQRWRKNVPGFARVSYRRLYPGIDAAFYGNHHALEYDFIVAPGADPRRLSLRFAGAEGVSLTSAGDLLLHTPAGDVLQQKPVSYQIVAGQRREVLSHFEVRPDGTIGFAVGAYDARQTLIIDPVLLFSTFLGGSAADIAWAVAVDAAGNSYVTGYTDSSDFPTAGPVQPVSAGGRDIFVTKLNPTGSGIVYSTYIGGMGTEEGRGIAVDTAGNVYVGGYTDGSDFPVTPGAFQTGFGGVDDCVVFKLNAAGDTLLYSTYLGGNNEDPFGGIAIDGSGNAYIGGSTRSLNFPTTPGSYQPALTGFRDIFVTKLNPTGSALVYSTYVGGGNFDDLLAITVDASDQVHFAGRTFFNFSVVPYPTTPGAFQSSYDGIRDAVVTTLNASGSALLFSTLLGGTAFDEAQSIAVDAAGNTYVGGWTFSADFPTTPGAFQAALAGDNDGFVAKINPTGTGLVYSTLLGGSFVGGTEVVRGLALDSSSNAWVVGNTQSTDFPAAGAIQAANAGSSDAFIAKLNSSGSALAFSTYLGSLLFDEGDAVALDALPNPNAYVVGHTSWGGSPNPFPTTPGVVQPALGGGNDGFVAKIGELVIPPATGKVTGGGTINVAGGTGNFGFIVQRDSTSDPITGELQYHNKATGEKLKSVSFTSFNVTGNISTYAGTCTLNGAACTFSVSVTDNGEPGANDVFTISVNAGPNQGGVLRSGNVKIH